jgi:putative transposase
VNRFKATTESRHNLPVAENLLNQQFEVSKPNAAWLSDITYIPTDEGWLYLAGHKDIFNGEIVGYAMGARMTKSLVTQSLFRAVATKRPVKGLIHHSDRGSQYCAHEYRKILEQFGMKASMSGKGNCFYNAAVESFFKTIKSELVWRMKFLSRRQANDMIAKYIQGFYNPERRHSTLGYLSPVEFEKRAA